MDQDPNTMYLDPQNWKNMHFLFIVLYIYRYRTSTKVLLHRYHTLCRQSGDGAGYSGIVIRIPLIVFSLPSPGSNISCLCKEEKVLLDCTNETQVLVGTGHLSSPRFRKWFGMFFYWLRSAVCSWGNNLVIESGISHSVLSGGRDHRKEYWLLMQKIKLLFAFTIVNK